MERKNCCRMKTIFRVCRSKAIEDKARGDNEKAYTRRRKMPVYDIIESIVTKRGLTTSMEIYNFIKRKEDSQTISVQGYLAQRKKLNPEVFIRAERFNTPTLGSE